MEDLSSHKDLDARAHGLDCAEVAERVYAFLDGQMSLEELTVYQRHLELCLPCRALVDFENKLITMIKAKGAGGAEIPATLMDKIKNALANSSNPKN